MITKNFNFNGRGFNNTLRHAWRFIDDFFKKSQQNSHILYQDFSHNLFLLSFIHYRFLLHLTKL